MAEKFAETLWKLSLEWPCEYARVIGEAKSKDKPGLAVSLHVDSCRRCRLQLHLLQLDELLKSVSERDPHALMRDMKSAVSLDEVIGIKEHADFVRKEFLGCPEDSGSGNTKSK